MKMLRIEVENLNSLYGKQVVALEEQFGGEPLFLITGPTGAGKSTLMDAVSLALFGRTPRLSDKSGKPEQDPGHILSRGTGSGGAALEFSVLETRQAVRYRATWSVRRAKGLPDGKLQDPKRMLERQDHLGQWHTLVSSAQPTHVKPHFDKVLAGMTVDDFQRAVLLAQGQFAAFLQATEEERAKILERLTGTGHYLAIGQRASVKKSEHEQALKDALVRLNAVQSLSTEEEQLLVEQQQTLTGQVVTQEQTLAQEQQALQWLERSATLARQLAEAEDKWTEAQRLQEAAASELSQLAEHERCASAASALGAVDEQIRQQDKQQAELSQIGLEVGASQLQVEQHTPVVAQARKVLEEQRSAADALRPEIGRARAIYAQHKTQQTALQMAQTDHMAAAAKRNVAEADLFAKQTLASQNHTTLQAAESKLIELQGFAPLVTAAAGLAQQHNHLLADHKNLQERTKVLGHQKQQQAKIETDRAAAADQRQSLLGQTAPLREALQAAEVALRLALDGAADPGSRRAALRSQREELAQRAVAATRALDNHAQVENLTQQKTVAVQALEDLQAAQDRAREQHNLWTTQLGNARESQTRLQAEHKALQLLRQLVAERAQLQSGEPCPLCGGLDHPYVEGGRLEAAETHALLRSGELEHELADLAQQTETLQTSLQTLALEQAAQGQQRLQQTQDVARLARELKAAVTAWHDSLSQLGLPAAVDAAAVREVQTSVSGLQLACARAEQVLDAAEAEQRKAMQTVQAAESKLASLDTQLAGYTATVEQQRQTLARLQEELDAAQVAVQAQLQTLSGQLHAVGIDGPESLQCDADWRQLAAALQLVSQRAAAFVAAEQTHKQATAAAVDSTAAAQRAEDAVVAAQAAQQTAALALAKQQAELEHLTAELQQVLQGRDPEVVDRELTAALQTAEHQAKAATDALQTAERRLLTATTRLQETQRLLSQTAEQLAKQEDILANAIAELGLPDVTALRHRLLPEPEVQVLRHKRQALQQATAVATGHRNGRQEDVRHHAEQRPASLLLDATAQGLQAAIQDLTATLNHHRDALAAIRARLNQNASNHAERDRLQQDVTAKQQVNAVWQRLHKLIGVNSGQSFQQFAQILNLEELAGKANHHLQLLAPRYKLVVARNSDLEPRLDFAVEDEYQAEERRPLTTLSGGETFLVSLSLALALADYRAVQMPIETLLLDEGFGTLDPQTLASAMTALKAMSQSSGVQVGLISHVESLKQEIAARVVVERQGNGRSVVRMEVGL